MYKDTCQAKDAYTVHVHSYIMLNIDIDNTLYVHKGQNESRVCTYIVFGSSTCTCTVCTHTYAHTYILCSLSDNQDKRSTIYLLCVAA